MRQNAQDYPEGHPARRTLDYVGEGEEQLRFENYVGSLIDGGAITESAKHTYQHTLKNHISGTKLGRTALKLSTYRMLRPWRMSCLRRPFWTPTRRLGATPGD